MSNMEFCVKNRRLMLVIDRHLIIRCLMVNSALQNLHLGRGDLVIRNECVNRLCPNLNLAMTVSSLRDFLEACLVGPKIGLME